LDKLAQVNFISRREPHISVIMKSFSRVISIAYLLTQALPSALSANDHCNLNDTLTLNITWDLTPCTRADGVEAYTDPAGGCCMTLDIETCTAHESCIFVTSMDACGTCWSVEYVNSELSTNGTTCEEVSAEFEIENPFADELFGLYCDASTSLDCCYEGNLPDYSNYTSDCDGLDAEECVVDGADGACSLWYDTVDDCYTCTGSVIPCGELQTFIGNDSTIRVYCDSDNVGDAPMCDEESSTTWPAETDVTETTSTEIDTTDIETTEIDNTDIETTEIDTTETETTEIDTTETDTETTELETTTTTTTTTTSTTTEEEESDTTTTEVEDSGARVYVLMNMLTFVTVALFMVTF